MSKTSSGDVNMDGLAKKILLATFILGVVGASQDISNIPCQSLYDSSTVTFSCNKDGTAVSCENATDNTTMTYRCAPYYELSFHQEQELPKTSTCRLGSWGFIPECVPVCGEQRVSAIPLVIDGYEMERGLYPWAVALYSDKDSDPYFTNICGGSLITPEIVITAAHCVTKKETGKPYPTRYYKVGAGKYYNKYEDPRDNDTAQYAEVERIEKHAIYRGEIQNFQGDLALLKLKTKLTLSKAVQPICLNKNVDSIIPQNPIGVITGWGYTTSSGSPSETLKELELQYNEDERCLIELDEGFARRDLTFDKFCAKPTKGGTAPCRGDAGGGLVFKNPKYNRYFIHGVLSLGPSHVENHTVHCDLKANVLFSRVDTLRIDWIQQKIQEWTVK